VLFKRWVSPQVIFNASMVFVSTLLLLFGFTLAIEVAENRTIEKVIFEVASALGTVGLSTGDGGILSLSATFGSPGKLLIVLAMFIGRLGPVTLGLAAVFREDKAIIQYPEGKVSIG
jgi:trk system potassium uptake protein TrkH